MFGRRKPLVQARKRFQRDARAFLTKSIARRAAEILRVNRDAFDRALLRANGDGAAIERARVKTRRSIDRALRQQIPGYAQFRMKQQANAETYRTLVDQQRVAAVDDRVNLELGAVVSDQLITQEFEPPYPLSVVDLAAGSEIVSDSSLADPRAGFAINNITFDYDQHTSIWDELGIGFVIDPAPTTRASVGVTYTVPRTGRLTVYAVLQNLFNYVTYSLTDNFGMSHGSFLVSLLLFVRIIRSDSVVGFDRLLYQNGPVAHSSTNLGGTFSGLNMATPYTLSATTDETFDEGETVQVMVGSSVGIECDVNDMEAFVKATLAWQVTNLYLGV